jgi:hypothetical protein
MIEVKEIGGARIGMANATWPFATLTVNREKLQLNASMLGNLVFKPTDIISIVPCSGVISSGLKINHKVPKYKDDVVFWTFGNPNEIIKQIEQTGFFANTSPISADLDKSITKAQSQGGFPLKITAAIAIGVIWNVLFLIDFQNFFSENKVGSPLGLGAQLALGFILSICILLLTFEPARRLILKEGRTVSDINKIVYFVMFICGCMLLTSILMN